MSKIDETLRERNRTIDIARGIGILLVIVGHAISDIYDPINKFILSFHMPLFFVLSGMLFNPERICTIPFTKYIKNKAFHLLVPQLTLGIIEICYHIGLFKSGIESEFINPLYSVFRWWFLIVMFEIAILNYIFSRLKLCKNQKSTISIIFVTILISAITIRYFNNIDGTFLLYLNVLPVAYFFYLLGYLIKIKAYLLKKVTNRITQIVLIPILLVMLIFVSMNNSPVRMYSNEYGNIVLFLISAFLGTLLIMQISSIVKKNTLLEWCGRNSIIIYVLQFHINIIIRYLFNKVLNYSPLLTNVSCVFSAIVITIFLSWICRKYIPFVFGIKK